MKKLFYPLLILTSLLIFTLSAIAQGFATDYALNPSEMTQKELNQQSILGINWVQTSGEYRALAYQGFNVGKIAFDRAIEHNIPHPAVLVDLDETLLDNTPYQASLIGADEGFNTQTWNQWILAEETRAVPGAVEFVNYINDNGGKVFFISNRNNSSTYNPQNNDLELATMKNMIELGFEGVTEETLLLKGEFTKTINGRVDTRKQWRMDAITGGMVDSIDHSAIMFVGDNLNDFSEIDKNNNEVRKEFVDNTQAQQGIFVLTENGFKPAYISIPNPMYGYWENGLYDAETFGKSSIWDLTPAQKLFQRIESLIRWKN